MRIAGIATLACLLMGCAGETEITQINQPVVDKVAGEHGGWSVNCELDKITAVRTCEASTHPTKGVNFPFRIVFFDKDGPYIMPGMHTHPTNKAVIRVDDSQPVYLTNFNEFNQQQTGRALKTESKLLVEKFKKASVAKVRAFYWPNDSYDTEINLNGFKDTYELLLKKTNEQT